MSALGQKEIECEIRRIILLTGTDGSGKIRYRVGGGLPAAFMEALERVDTVENEGEKLWDAILELPKAFQAQFGRRVDEIVISCDRDRIDFEYR